MNTDADKRALQDEEYVFPYHYLPSFKEGMFRQARNLFWGYEYASHTQYVLDHLSTQSLSSLLDIGCGDGRLLHEISSALPSVQLTGIDFSDRAIQFARAFSPRIEFRVGETSALVAEGKTYDCITLIEVLEHVPPESVPALVAEIASLLSPTGFLLMTVPTTNEPVIAKHYQHFTEALLRSTLGTHFTVEVVEFIHANTLGDKVLRRLFSNQFFILNHEKALAWLYRFYTQHYLKSTAAHGKRVLVRARVKHS